MKTASKVLSALAALGFFLSLIVHALSVSGSSIGADSPFVFLLHAGIFVVWFPSIIFMMNNEEVQAFKKSKSRNSFLLWKVILKGTPSPLIIIMFAAMAYAFLNFAFFMQNSEGGGPGIIDGQYVIHNHGQIIRSLTKNEYLSFKANELRGFSGHWMAFYSAALALLWPKSNAKN